MISSGVLDNTLFQVMTECLMGTEPLFKCNYIHFIPNDFKNPNMLLWYVADFPIKQYQELFLTNCLANIIENFIFIRFICFRFMKFGWSVVQLGRTDSQDEGTG